MPKRKIDDIYDEYDVLIIKIFKNVIMTFKIQDSLLKKMSIRMIQCVIKILEFLCKLLQFQGAELCPSSENISTLA